MEKTGHLIYDFIQNRYDICYSCEEYAGGLHCGDCFQVKINEQWIETRIELNAYGEWYLVGIDPSYGMYNLEVKTNCKVYRIL